MKKALLLIILIMLSLFYMHLNAEPTKALMAKLESKISEVEGIYIKTNGFDTEFEEGFFTLMDTIMMTAQESEKAGDFKDKVAEAVKHFKQEGVFVDGKANPPGLSLLWEAFHLIKEDIPLEGNLPQDVAEDFQAKLNRARKYLKIGQTRKVSEILLESALILFPPPPLE